MSAFGGIADVRSPGKHYIDGPLSARSGHSNASDIGRMNGRYSPILLDELIELLAILNINHNFSNKSTVHVEMGVCVSLTVL